MGIYIMSKIKRLSASVCVIVMLSAFMGCQEKNTFVAGGERGKAPFSFTQNEEEFTASYILNISSQRIHLPSCRYAKTIAPDNRLPVSDLSQALAEGYTYCSRCLAHSTDTENEENENAKTKD